MNLPTLLTWMRIGLIPVFVGVFSGSELNMHEKNLVAASIFGFAALTDWLDGYLARQLKQTSSFGAFLDPVADKLMVSAALILLVYLERAQPLAAYIIIGREIAISALREWMALLGRSKNMAVSFLGKFKTVVQMVAIVVLLLGPDNPLPLPQFFGAWMLNAAALMTVISMAYYLRRAYDTFHENPPE